ncbi:MAG: flagellar basal body L-ring protein FlgH [Acidobacteria bacterium]|nr:flagellar basal body L-ring protein FlgH [Acidobacteriota bacterium]
MSMLLNFFICGLLHFTLLPLPVVAAKHPKEKPPTPLEVYVREATSRRGPEHTPPPGSLWTPSARFADLGADLRASRVDDLITILVSDRAAAVSKGDSKTARSSSVKAGVDAFGIVPKAGSVLPNLAKASSQQSLDGTGQTSRESTLTATLSARVIDVLPNGNLVVEGTKNVVVNSENQMVRVRGVIRPVDLDTNNMIISNRIAQLDVQINGKGVVGDAVRRPMILYRILLGLLPF